MLIKQTTHCLLLIFAMLHSGGAAHALSPDESLTPQTTALLSNTLTENAAVELALMNNLSIQAMLSEVGVSQAELQQAAQWPNPGYSFGVFQQGDERSVENGLHFNLGKLLFRNEIKSLAHQRLVQTQKQLAARMIQLGQETRKAHVEAVAAQETVKYMQQVWTLAKASADLAQKMLAAGNFNKLQQAREKVFEADALMGLKRAQRKETSARERLGRLMGLPSTQMNFTLPQQLPELPQFLDDSKPLEDRALRQRFDVQLAKLESEQTASNLGLTKASRFVNVLEVGVTNKTSNQSVAERGLQIGFELPLFDTGEARTAKAQAKYMQSVHVAAQVALNAQSEVREAYANYKAAYELVIHQRDVVLPLQESIAEENLLRYNGMLMGVFELLSESRQQIASVTTYMTLLKEFWLAQIDLDMAMSGKPNLAVSAETPSSAIVSPAH